MKKTVVFIFALVITSILCGCKTSGKNVLKKRIERMESSSNNPVSIEEIEAAIKEYSKEKCSSWNVAQNFGIEISR